MKYVCDACGWGYDEILGDPENGIAPGTNRRRSLKRQKLLSALTNCLFW